VVSNKQNTWAQPHQTRKSISPSTASCNAATANLQEIILKAIVIGSGTIGSAVKKARRDDRQLKCLFEADKPSGDSPALFHGGHKPSGRKSSLIAISAAMTFTVMTFAAIIFAFMILGDLKRREPKLCP
jgi:hypothetical protein